MCLCYQGEGQSAIKFCHNLWSIGHQGGGVEVVVRKQKLDKNTAMLFEKLHKKL